MTRSIRIRGKSAYRTPTSGTHVAASHSAAEDAWLLAFLVALALIPWIGVTITGAWSSADLAIATLLLLFALPELAHIARTRRHN
jgi:hypothetical protein